MSDKKHALQKSKNVRFGYYLWMLFLVCVFIGWLKIPGTDINYPVMQTVADEDYYIDKDFDQEYSRVGMLFADASSDVKTPSDNILIYGHNMKSGNMFHDLLLREEEVFFIS